jgi:hypothetical protein
MVTVRVGYGVILELGQFKWMLSSFLLFFAILSCEGFLLSGPASIVQPERIAQLCQGWSSRGGLHQNIRQIHSNKKGLEKGNGPTALFMSHSSNDDKNIDFSNDELFQRILQLRVLILEEEIQRPPNPELSPQAFVTQILEALNEPDDPMPDSGFRLLLRASTRKWRNLLKMSIGAPADADDEVVIPALGAAIGRPKNQFGILVGADDAEEYTISFPSDILDFEDGTCWLECRLRGKETNELLVAMGWSLKRRKIDGAWVVDELDWQDFRDEYRPGIGREEWMRICG